jgi:co-chaperonin GroES (HSP10)
MSKPKGTKHIQTILKDEAKKQMDIIISQRAHALVDAGLSVALGSVYVYKMDKDTKKPVQITDPDQIAYAIEQMTHEHSQEDSEYFYITRDKPDHKAIEMLLNRTFGKAKESLDLSGEVKFSLLDMGRSIQEARKLQPDEYKLIENVEVV